MLFAFGNNVPRFEQLVLGIWTSLVLAGARTQNSPIVDQPLKTMGMVNLFLVNWLVFIILVSMTGLNQSFLFFFMSINLTIFFTSKKSFFLKFIILLLNLSSLCTVCKNIFLSFVEQFVQSSRCNSEFLKLKYHKPKKIFLSYNCNY